MDVGKISRQEVKLALVANRLREPHSVAGAMERILGSIHIPYSTLSTEINQTLTGFLKGMKIPLVAGLRDSENYLRADARGLGIFELGPSEVRRDLDTWQPLLQWLTSRRSIPRKRKQESPASTPQENRVGDTAVPEAPSPAGRAGVRKQ